jgi:biotin synthesis protein BioG
MKRQWIRRNDSPGLILFLNGWGMDAGTVTPEPPTEWDLVTFFDYRNLEIDEAACRLPEKYETVVLVAWSMGVWAAGVFAPLAEKITTSVAVNGTSRPIDDEYGIPRELYEETVKRFSEKSRSSFYRRMCGGAGAAERFRRMGPGRPLDEQRRELDSIRRHCDAGTPRNPYPFDTAVIGGRDRIMPTENQLRHWNSGRHELLPGVPHFPFFHFGWKELLHYAGLHR